MHDVQHPTRQPGLDADFRQQVSCHRGHLAGLGHHAVACRKGWGYLPRKKIKWQVPRRYAAHYANGLAQGVVDGLDFHMVALGAEVHEAGGIKAEVGRCTGDVYLLAEPQRLAVVVGFGKGQCIVVFVNQFRNAVQYFETFFRRRGAPTGKGRLCGTHSFLHIAGIAVRSLAVHCTRCRVYIVDVVAAQRSLQAAANVIGYFIGSCEIHWAKVRNTLQIPYIVGRLHERAHSCRLGILH